MSKRRSPCCGSGTSSRISPNQPCSIRRTSATTHVPFHLEVYFEPRKLLKLWLATSSRHFFTGCMVWISEYLSITQAFIQPPKALVGSLITPAQGLGSHEKSVQHANLLSFKAKKHFAKPPWSGSSCQTHLQPTSRTSTVLPTAETSVICHMTFSPRISHKTIQSHPFKAQNGL